MKKLYVSDHISPGGNKKTDALKAIFGKLLSAVPDFWACPEMDPFPDDPRVKAIRFTGLPCKGRNTEVFAYIGFPEGASAKAPVPGMVLVHGGAGHAYAEWVQYWIDNGFAAISFDGFGQQYTGPYHTYDASLDLWGPDPAAAFQMNSFEDIGRPFEEQWFTHYIADTLLANSLLREDPRVIREQIGLTGISWGGYSSSVAICYDNRFAFAAPVYGSGFQNASNTVWGQGFREKDVLDQWDAGLLLSEVSTPVCWFNSDNDPFFGADSTTACAAAAPNGSATLLHGFTHGQTEGSLIPEILRFALEKTCRGEGNIKIDSLRNENGFAELCYTLPSDVEDAEACVYYKTEPLQYEGKHLREAWHCKNGTSHAGKAIIPVPAEACVFYFSISGRSYVHPSHQILHATSGIYTRVLWD